MVRRSADQLLKMISSKKWLPFLLPSLEDEQSVLSEAGVSEGPNTQASVGPQDPSVLPSPPTSPQAAPGLPPPLRRLLDETADLIDSPMFTHVLTLVLDTSFSQLVDIKLRSETYKLPALGPEPLPETRITEVADTDPANVATKLAIILAFMTREAHKIGSGVPNEYVQAIESVSELEGFAAVIYSSNLEVGLGQGTGLSPEVSLSSSDDQAATDEDPAITAADGSGDPVPEQKCQGIFGKATDAVDAAYAGFESVWSRVTGK